MSQCFQIYEINDKGKWSYIMDGYPTLKDAEEAIMRSATPGSGRLWKITRIVSYEEDVKIVDPMTMDCASTTH